VVHTHELLITGRVLTKRYTSWHRGEHRREWLALIHVHPYAPDLVPRPLSARLDAIPPEVDMTVLPGRPLHGCLSTSEIDALVDAVNQLWSVPHEAATGLEPAVSDLDFARYLTSAARPDGGLTAAAYDAASAWWTGPDPDVLGAAPTSMVLGHRDPNLTNYLWDGQRVRIVDFEDAARSDPAMELAILAEHVSARHLDTEALCARFDVDRARLLAARRLWAMFWLSLLLPGGRSQHRNPPDAADAQARRLLSLLDNGETT
jgi:hypothetical protein